MASMFYPGHAFSPAFPMPLPFDEMACSIAIAAKAFDSWKSCLEVFPGSLRALEGALLVRKSSANHRD